MTVPSKMSDLFTLAASNSPQGSDLIGNSLDDYIRSGFAILRSTNALASASIAAASTTDLSTADAESVQITGSSTINSLGTAVPGLIRECRFAASCTLINSANIVLPGSANITTNTGDVITFRSLGSGIWTFVTGTSGVFLPLTGGRITGPVQVDTSADGTIGLTIKNTFAGGNGSQINFLGQGGTTPNKVLRVSNGVFQLVNSAGSANILQCDDAGNFSVAGGLGGTSIAVTGTGSIGTTLAVNGGTITTTLSGVTTYWQLNPFAIAGTFGVGTASNIPFIIGMNNAESVRVANGGVVTMSGASSGNGAQLNMNGNGATTPNKTIRARAGNLEIVNSANTAIISTLTDGGIWTATDFIATSDKRLKKKVNTKQPNDRLADLLRLCTWLWKKTGAEGCGVIAQEVQRVAPEYVHIGVDGVLGVDKSGLALECVIGLAARVRTLEGD